MNEIRDENSKKMYKEKKNKAKKAVALAKGRAYEDLYARLETKEGERELYRLARQRSRAVMYVCMYVFISQPQQHKSKHKNTIKAGKKEAVKNDIRYKTCKQYIV